jgi:hypothetical protein
MQSYLVFVTPSTLKLGALARRFEYYHLVFY